MQNENIDIIDDIASDAAIEVYIGRTTLEEVLQPMALLTRFEYRYFMSKYRKKFREYQKKYGIQCPWS